MADNQPAADDDAGADPEVTVQVDEVVDAHRHAPDVFGQAGDVGQVSGDETRAHGEFGLERGAQQLVGTADPDPPVTVTGRVGHRDRAAHQQRLAGDGALHVADQAGQRADRVED